MRQHFVPRFLPRAWTGPDHRLQVFRLDESRIRSFRRAPKSVAWREDLYSLKVPRAGKGDNHKIETGFLQQIDDKAAKARTKLLNPARGCLTPEESRHWVLFLMSLRARQPHAVEHLRETGSKDLRVELDRDSEEYRAIAQDGDPESLSEWVRENVPDFVENWAISQFPAISTHPRTLETILSMRYTSVVNFTGCTEHLLLSDDPCIWVYGFDHPRFSIALPISPYAAFLATGSETASRNLRRLSREKLLTNLNISSVNQARKYVYALDASPQEFIRSCRGGSQTVPMRSDHTLASSPVAR